MPVDQVIVPDDDVDCSVQLDAAQFGSGKLPLYVDVVDIVVFDEAEHGSQMAADTRLLAFENLVVADDVRTDVLLAPSLVVGLEDGLELPVESDELLLDGPTVLARRAVLAEADAAAFRIADDIVFDDPSLAPVRAHQTRLERGGRGPVHRRLRHMEALDGNVVHAGQFGEEHGLAGIDFHQFLVGVGAAEIGPDGGFGVGDLGIPLKQ